MIASVALAALAIVSSTNISMIIVISNPQKLLRHVIELLNSKGWTRARETTRFFVYVPPETDSHAGGYQLFIPRDPTGEDFARSIESSIQAIASYDDVPMSIVMALLMPRLPLWKSAIRAVSWQAITGSGAW